MLVRPIILTGLLISLFLFACGAGDDPGVIAQVPTPTNVTAKAGDSAIDVSWNELKEVQFKLYYGLTSGLFDGTDANEGMSPVILPEGSKGFSLTGLTNGNTYYIALSAFNAAKESEISTETFATPLGDTLLEPSSLNLQCEQESIVTNAATLHVYDIGLEQKNFYVDDGNSDWLSADKSNIVVPEDITLSLDCTGLTPGQTYNTTIIVGGGGKNQSVPVSLSVLSLSDPPELAVFDQLDQPLEHVYFTCVSGQISLAAQNIKIANIGGQQISFTSSSDNTFVSLAPESGLINALSDFDAQIQADCYMIAQGSHDSVLTIEAAGVNGSPYPINVHITALESTLDPPDYFSATIDVLLSTCYYNQSWSWNPPMPETVTGYILFTRSVHDDGDWGTREFDDPNTLAAPQSASRRQDYALIYDYFVKAKYANGLSGPTVTRRLTCPAK